jgi:hypothetical protein
MARWKRRAAGATRYLTDIDLRTSIDSDDLIERVAVRTLVRRHDNAPTTKLVTFNVQPAPLIRNVT